MGYPALLAEGGTFSYSTRDAINALISGQGLLSQGNVWWVRPLSGSDTNDGKSPSTAFATLTAALAAATANQNDIVLLCAEGNSASATTAYQATTLTWNKDMVHLIGLNAGPLFSQRSRIAFSAGATVAGDLFDLTANGCLIQGIEFFMGVASANPTGCMTVSGIRNHFFRCHIAGFGNAANDINNAYSLQLKGAEECLFEDCTIGVDTVAIGTGTTTAQILFTAGTSANTRNWFRGCRVVMDATSSTNFLFVRGGGAGNLDRETVFEDCLFINAIASGATTLTHGMNIATGGGVVILTGAKTGLFGASGWNANSGVVYATGGIQPTNNTWGLATAITS
jgi:hypothetical protein